MKKFTKLFLSCAIVSAMAVTASASVFATQPESVDIKSTDGLTGKATISADNKVTITNLGGITPAASSEVTFLVFQGTQDVSANASNVEGIDQNTAAATNPSIQPTNNGLKSAKWIDTPTADDVTTYTIMVGYTDSTTGEFQTAKGTFELTQVTGEKYIIGDVDASGAADGTDAAYIMYKEATYDDEDHIGNTGKTLTITDTMGNTGLDNTTKVGDVDNSGDADGTDAAYIMYKEATYDDEDHIGNTGKEVKATIDAATAE